MLRKTALAATFLIVSFAVVAAAQQTDYLTPEEVQKVRETQEPNKRVQLFLEYAQDRWTRLETVTQDKDARFDDLRDRLNDFISAVDDAAEALDIAMERGGVDLRKTRKDTPEKVQALLDNLKTLRENRPDLLQTDLSYDLDDAVEATEDFLALTGKIPDEPIPPKMPAAVTDATGEKVKVPGQPTLKRPGDDGEKEKRPPR